jgi:dynein heavy chain
MLKDSITLNLYKKICIGLFEEHKIVYAFLICTSIKRSENKIQEAYWNLLIRGTLLNDKAFQPIKPDSISYLVTDS